jgi:excisionase family DNA binding protein
MHQNIISVRLQKVIPKLETVHSKETVENTHLATQSIKPNSHSEEHINQSTLQTEAYVLLTIAQVAMHLQVSRAHVYRLISQGLPTIHLGRSVRINAISLNRWLSEQETHY